MYELSVTAVLPPRVAGRYLIEVRTAQARSRRALARPSNRQDCSDHVQVPSDP